MKKPRLEIEGKHGLERYHVSFSGLVRTATLPPARAEQNVRRLLEFASLDLAGLSAVGQEDWSSWFDVFVRGRESEIPIILRSGAMRALQRRAKELLATYFRGERVGYETRQGWQLVRKADGTPALELRIDGVFWDLFTWHAVQALAAVGPRLKLCADPTCRRPFVASRRQTYCTRGCSDRTRLARFRAKHAKDETLGAKIRQRRRAAYAKRIRSKLGPRVDVGTRRAEQGSGGVA